MKDDKGKYLTQDEQLENDAQDGYYQPDQNPESHAEATRKSGLAYGAVIALVGSILFFLAVGWGVDKYFQTEQRGIVIGILVGSVLGFYQFIRLSARLN